MKIFSLEKKEYKKYAKEFRNTYAGGGLYLIFDFFSCFALINFIWCGIGDMFFEDSKNIISGDFVCFGLYLICALISYYVYFKYLAKYIESKK